MYWNYKNSFVKLMMHVVCEATPSIGIFAPIFESGLWRERADLQKKKMS